MAFTDQNLLAEIHANRDANGAKFNHLVQLVSNQFTQGDGKIVAFEHRIVHGCK